MYINLAILLRPRFCGALCKSFLCYISFATRCLMSQCPWSLFLLSLWVYDAILNFGIRRPKAPAQQHRRFICESLRLVCASVNSIRYDVYEPLMCLGGCRRPFIIKNMMVTCTSCGDVVIVAGKPASLLWFEKDVVHVKYFTEPPDIFVKPLHFSHLYIFLVSGLQADTKQVGVNRI